jgi:hypothetical protein
VGGKTVCQTITLFPFRCSSMSLRNVITYVPDLRSHNIHQCCSKCSYPRIQLVLLIPINFLFPVTEQPLNIFVEYNFSQKQHTLQKIHALFWIFNWISGLCITCGVNVHGIWNVSQHGHFRDPKTSVTPWCFITDLEGHTVYESESPLGICVDE